MEDNRATAAGDFHTAAVAKFEVRGWMMSHGESPKQSLVVVGWAEYVDFPEWNVRRLRAKMDTGARSSALHVENIEELPHGRVRFDVRLHRKKLDRRVTVETTIVRRSRVRSSSGVSEARIFVRALVQIGPVLEPIEMSLVSREKMLYRMLIGRTALSHRFLVDVGKRYLVSKPRKKTVKTQTKRSRT